jgi:hypothetical protein
MISNSSLVEAATPPLPPLSRSAPRKVTGPSLRPPGSLPRSLRDGPRGRPGTPEPLWPLQARSAGRPGLPHPARRSQSALYE